MQYLFVVTTISLYIISISSAQTLNSLTSLSKLIDAVPLSNTTTNNNDNINIVQNTNNGENIKICYMPYLASFSRDGEAINNNEVYEGLASVALAMEHLNTGNGTIIPELDGLNERCSLQFYTYSFDSMGQEAVSVNTVLEITDPHNIDNEELAPCAFLSATGSPIAIMTSTISDIKQIPHISALATSSILDHPGFNYFGRTIPNDRATSIPLLQKLRGWGVNHLGILNINDVYGNDFADAIRAASAGPDFDTVAVNINVDFTPEGIERAIHQLKNTKYTYFFAIIPGRVLDDIMTEAYKQGIAGSGLHTWLFADGIDTYDIVDRSFAKGSPLSNAYKGSGLLEASAGERSLQPTYDKFFAAMQNLRNEQDLAFIDSHLPWASDYVLNNEIPVNHSKITDSDRFLYWPGYVGPFLYDATVAIGMAACSASSSSGVTNVTGEEMFQNFIGMEFEGASYNVKFEDTGTRTADSALFSLTNFVLDEETAEEEMQFLRVKTDIWGNGTWYNVKVPFVFNDGSTTPPADLPPITVDQNHLSKGFRAVGGILCAIIVCMSIGFGVWTFKNRAVQVIRASQPIFLYIIAVGTLLFGISIIPLSVDRGVGNEKGASIACMAVPWFIAMGFSLIFSALFTKTWRIYTIMKNAKKFKRIKLTVMDVIKPMAFLLSLNIIILSVWTAIDPLKSNIEIARTDEFDRALETYGVCQSEHGRIFLPILVCINLGCLLVTVLQACRARHISTELSESKYILRALWIILYVSFLAVPIIIIARDKAEAFYFVVTGFIFVVCTSILLLIFGPKFIAVRKKKKNKTKTPKKQWGLTANNKANNREENKANSLDIEGNSTVSDSSSGIKIMGINKSTTLRNENEVMRRENEELKRLLDEAGIEYQSKERNGEASQ